MVDTKGFSVYPNPTNDVVNIVFERSANTNSRVELLSMTGQVLQYQEVGAGNSSLVLPVQQLPNGCYLIRVSSAGQPATFRKINIVH